MAKVKKGDALNCEVCGLVVVVDEACGCAAAEILCCEQPMVKGKSAAKKKPAAKAVAAPAKTRKKRPPRRHRKRSMPRHRQRPPPKPNRL